MDEGGGEQKENTGICSQWHNNASGGDPVMIWMKRIIITSRALLSALTVNISFNLFIVVIIIKLQNAHNFTSISSETIRINQ